MQHYNKGLQIEERADGSKYFTGYAAKWYDGTPDTEFHLYGNKYERIAPDAFDKALQESPTVATLEHDNKSILATRSGTLKLTKDSVGLKFSFPFDGNDPDHQRAKAKFDRGDLSGASFRMVAPKYEWRREGDKVIGNIRSIVALEDVALVSVPAYLGSTFAMRSQGDIEAAEQSFKQWEESKQWDEIINCLTK